jgi:hypothetical protein
VPPLLVDAGALVALVDGVDAVCAGLAVAVGDELLLPPQATKVPLATIASTINRQIHDLFTRHLLVCRPYSKLSLLSRENAGPVNLRAG